MALALTLLVPGSRSAADETKNPSHSAASNFPSVRELIRTRMVNESIPSVAVALAKDGKILWEEGFGWADRERRIPADPHTLYALASVTKPITATALMILRERGRLDLDRPVNEYLRGSRLVSPAWDPSQATVRRVATHTAGLATHDEPDRRLSLDETIARYGVIVRPPGERFDYSNLGYKILGGVIAHVSAKTYADFLRSEVFLPLGMTRGSVGVGPGLGAYTAAHYGGGGGARVGGNEIKPTSTYVIAIPGSHGIYCSAHDLLQFALFHLKADLPSQKAILPHGAIDAMQNPTATVDADHRYGLGWWVKENHFGYRVVFVHGGNSSASASLVLVPSERIAVTVLSNTGTGATGAICDQILSALLPRFQESRSKSANDPKRANPKNTTLPATLPGSWTGIVRTCEADIPFTISVAETGDIRAKLGSELGTILHLRRVEGQTLFARMLGDVENEDRGRSNHELDFELTLRGEVLNGAVTASHLSYWVELKRDKAASKLQRPGKE
jgi:CubicO group peptidase (beta-lactamase class C family)